MWCKRRGTRQSSRCSTPRYSTTCSKIRKRRRKSLRNRQRLLKKKIRRTAVSHILRSYSNTLMKSGVKAAITTDGTSPKRRSRTKWRGSSPIKSPSTSYWSGSNKSPRNLHFTNLTWKMVTPQSSKRSLIPSRYYRCVTSNTLRREASSAKTKSIFTVSCCKVLSRIMRNRFWSF